MAAEREPTWNLTPHWATGVVLGMVTLAAGLVLGRAELVVFAAPLVLVGAGAALRARPARVRAALPDDGSVARDGRLRVPLRWHAEGQLGVLRIRDGGGPTASVLLAGSVPNDTNVPAVVADLPLSGRRELFAWQFSAVSPDACLLQEPPETGKVKASVLPAVTGVAGGPLPRRLHGLTGSHASRTPGDGSEFRDIHPFSPGDSLRHIDWRATARRSTGDGQPYVRRTFATAEAAVTLVVDANDDLGPDAGTWLTRAPVSLTEPTSLHLLREASTAVAASYLKQGDRVGLAELVSYRRGLRAAPGRRQLELIRVRLAGLSAAAKVQRPAQQLELVPGCVAVVFSTFLDDEAARLMAAWQRLGHPVLGVDILPWLTALPADPVQQLAVRLELARRKADLFALREAGIPVFGWRGAVPATAGTSGVDTVSDQLPLEAGLLLSRSLRTGRLL